MPTDTLRDAIATYSELLRAHQLNIELLNTLDEALVHVQFFCKKHNIPFRDEHLSSILTKVENLLDEISSGISPNALCKLTDEFLQTKRTDEDLTESTERLQCGKTVGVMLSTVNYGSFK